MTIIHSIILGMMQGLTEFLPISSSGHLVIVPYIFNWSYQGKAFDVALHAGTAIAIVAFFWRDWVVIISNALNRPHPNPLPPRQVGAGEGIKETPSPTNVGEGRGEGSGSKYPNNILWQIIVASIPAGIIGLLINKYADQYLQSVPFIAFNLIFFGVLLWYIDKKSKLDLLPEKLTYKKSLLIGLSQSIALIPGVSRSGITMTASRLMGIPREEAARFSFLLATPTIVGAFLYKLKDIEHDGIGLTFWIGVLAATFFGLLAIKFLLNYLKKSDFSLFMWYRVVLAIIVLTVYLMR